MNEEYKLLNELEIDLSQYKEENVDELKKKKMFKKFKKSNKNREKYTQKRLASVLMIVAICGCFIIKQRDVRASVEIFTNNINNWLRIEKAYSTDKEKDYSTHIEKEIKVQGIDIKINEFFMVDDRVILNMDVKEKFNDVDDNLDDYIPEIYANNTKLKIDGYDYHDVQYKVLKIDENITSVLFEFKAEEVNSDNEENIKLVFSTLAQKNSIDENKLSITFKCDNSDYKNDCKVIDVNKSITLDDGSINIKQVIVKPDKIEIVGETNNFTPWDNNDNEYKYYYSILDQNNEENLGLKSEIGNNAYAYRRKQGITSIKIVPYRIEPIVENSIERSDNEKTKYIMEDKIIEIPLE